MQLSPTRFRLPKVLTVALLAGVLGPLLVAVRVPSAALADGDPASDVLLGSNVFYPFDPPVSPSAQRTLNAVTAAAQKARVKVKVALIAAPTDLGVIPSLFGKPQEYADFLYREITFLGPQRLLVVMSDGYGTQGLTPAAQKAVAALPNPAGKTAPISPRRGWSPWHGSRPRRDTRSRRAAACPQWAPRTAAAARPRRS